MRFMLLSFLLLGLSEAQFFPSGFGATQNCAGSQCNQNNFGRKKREILSELLALTGETQTEDADYKIDDIGLSRNTRKAQFFGGGATQNCAGSLCNQNNFGRRKREIAEAIVALAEEVAEKEAEEASVDEGEEATNKIEEAEEGLTKEKREADAQLQNCQDSSCNQNNLGVAPAGVLLTAPIAPIPLPPVAPVVLLPNPAVGLVLPPVILPPNPAVGLVLPPVILPPNPAVGLVLPPVVLPFNPAVGLVLPPVVLPPNPAVGLVLPPIVPVVPIPVGAPVGAAVQNCVGSSCNQNNFGRKKRAVIQALLDEADKITEEDFEPERLVAVAEEDNYDDSQNFQVPRSFLRGLFLLPEAELELKFSSSSKPTSTPETTPVHIVECSGPSSSFCKNNQCTVQCFDDGIKVVLECASNTVVVKSTAVGAETSRNEVSCG